ncbi:MAG: hypothetical protein IPL59_01915 [Candidatus Competibacteraceae bacterium]|nr:hypothetical protein [Candidatus Competibacteraceae bacterium]
MEIDKTALAQNYSAQSDDDLLALHEAGALTEMAYEVLEAELAHRGVAIPKRPEAPSPNLKTPHKIMFMKTEHPFQMAFTCGLFMHIVLIVILVVSGHFSARVAGRLLWDTMFPAVIVGAILRFSKPNWSYLKIGLVYVGLFFLLMMLNGAKA